MVPCYRGFSIADFDTRFRIPRHLVTLIFLGLAAKLRPIVRGLGAHFEWVMQDTFVDAVAALGIPRVRVALLDSSSMPLELEIVIDASTITQSLLVTGLPNQCLRCHGFGHQARVCPRLTRPKSPMPPASLGRQHREPPIRRQPH